MANKHNRKFKRMATSAVSQNDISAIGWSGIPLKAEDVKEGDFFILSVYKGYAGRQLREAMQVMECWPSTMTVKCSKGCMDKPYDHFQKITDLSGMDQVHSSDYFEDNRKEAVRG